MKKWDKELQLEKETKPISIYAMPASYTVEISWIMAISLTILCALILLGYDVYHDAISFAKESTNTVDFVSIFRKGQLFECMDFL